ncbi:hypothetical protein [Streptomyces sp. NPDC126503]|uniref:hypothetical protein n=1 Tax=Streptomyces sp. NPDC126503 TaxID=3155315 RepID=UPI0033248DA1
MTSLQALRAAQARRARLRRRLIAYGQWQPFVDAQPARAHVEAIRATGMSIASIVKHTGVNIGTIDHLIYGKKPYPPAAKIRPENAEAILAYWPVLDDYDDGAVIDGTGTRRRVQALALIGWPRRSIHQHVNHISVQAVEKLRTKERVTARTARAVRDLYNRVSEQPAEAHGVTPWVAARTRRNAAKLSYAPPSAWDPDTIDDPNAIPDWTGYCGTDRGWWSHRLENIPVCPPCADAHAAWLANIKHVSLPERSRLLAHARAQASNRAAAVAENARELLDWGETYETAALRLGISRNHLYQAMLRHPEQTAA